VKFVAVIRSEDHDPAHLAADAVLARVLLDYVLRHGEDGAGKIACCFVARPAHRITSNSRASDSHER
jgi:hypothetical protein